MKSVTSILFIALFMAPLAMVGQNSEMDIMRKIFSAEKKAVTEQFLQLQGTDANAFWDLYNAYETERKELSDKRITLIEDYANQYQTLTNEQASELVNRSFKLQQQRMKLGQKYFKKISKDVDAKTATSWYQLEQYIQTAINYELYDAIPFVGE